MESIIEQTFQQSLIPYLPTPATPPCFAARLKVPRHLGIGKSRCSGSYCRTRAVLALRAILKADIFYKFFYLPAGLQGQVIYVIHRPRRLGAVLPAHNEIQGDIEKVSQPGHGFKVRLPAAYFILGVGAPGHGQPVRQLLLGQAHFFSQHGKPLPKQCNHLTIIIVAICDQINNQRLIGTLFY